MAPRAAEVPLSATRSPAWASRIPFLKLLGIRAVEFGERHAEFRVRLGPAHVNSRGLVHGGLIATLVDVAAFFAEPLVPSGRPMATGSLTVSYLRSASPGDRLTARSEVLHLGRRTASVVVRVTDQAGRLLAHGSATLLFLDEPPARPLTAPAARRRATTAPPPRPAPARPRRGAGRRPSSPSSR